MKLRFAVVAMFMMMPISCIKKNQTETPMETAIAKNINVEEFNALLQSGKPVIVLDVRTEPEIAAGKIAGAREINLHDAQFASRVQQLEKDKPVLIYCRSGNRSHTAMKMMTGMGFTELYNLSGGIIAWSRAGLPIEKP